MSCTPDGVIAVLSHHLVYWKRKDWCRVVVVVVLADVTAIVSQRINMLIRRGREGRGEESERSYWWIVAEGLLTSVRCLCIPRERRVGGLVLLSPSYLSSALGMLLFIVLSSSADS